MKKFLTIFLLICLPVFAKVEIPNFSFVGKEISSYKISPTFTNIQINFSGKSNFSSYLQTAKIKISLPDKQKYNTEEPGNIYSSKFGTTISAIFVGEKAYRNYLIKNYLNENYFEVIENYKKYSEKLKDPLIKDEVKFIYAISLYKANFRKKAISLLESIIFSKNNYKNPAIDFYFDIIKDQDSNQVINIFEKLNIQTPYSTYIYLQSLRKAHQYKKILNFLDKKNELEKFEKEYYAISLYFTNQFEKLINYNFASQNILPFLIDAKIKLNNLDNIQTLMDKLESKYLKNYFSTKLKILEGKIKKISNKFKDIDKLSLMLFYIDNYFPNINIQIINQLQFDDKKLSDYKNFYIGLFYLKNSQGEKAYYYLNQIIFNEKLYTEAIFYKAVSLINIDPNEAKNLFLKYIDKSFDEKKVDIARFLAAQIELLSKNLDKAFLIVADCSTDYCIQIKAEIFFYKKNYEKVLQLTKHIKTNRAYYLRAASYYNLKKYKNALNELKKYQGKSRETDYLKMLLFFKNNQITQATNILKQYINDKNFVIEGVKYLFLAGRYQDVVKIIDESKIKDDYLTLLKAKAYFSVKNYNSAKELFQSLINKKSYLYDAIYGLMIIKKEMSDKNFINEIFSLIKSNKFANKDYLILQLAKIAYENNDKTNYLKLINYFFKNFPNSKNKRFAYILRGNFYKKNKMYKECLYDANAAIKIKEDFEALFLKAECLKEIDPQKTYNILKKLAKLESGYEFLSKKELIMLSKDKDEVLKYAEFFKDKNVEIYLKGIERYLNLCETINEETLQYIEELIQSKDKRYIPAGLYFKGKYLMSIKNYRSALKYFLKIYYIFKESEYTNMALQEAYNCYTALGEKEKAEKIKQLQKKLEG